jgi:hypothetical protein
MKNLLLVVALVIPATAFAAKPCEVITRAEASKILGVAAGKKLPQKPSAADADSSLCIIRSARNGQDMLKIDLATVAADDAEHMRAHTDEERGEETPSLHNEPWYQVSAVDATHPNDRRLVIHRDRTVLTLDVHSTHQPNVQNAFENVWVEIAQRLSADADQG